MKKLFLFSLLLIGACTPTNPKVFTLKMYGDWNWTEDQLKRVQFYLSHEIKIYRYLAENEGLRLKGGKIEMYKGKRAEVIHFPRYAKGQFIFHPNGDDNQFAIGFEEGDDTLYLTFGPNPNFGNRYLLQAKEWSDTGPTVTYGGIEFQVELPLDFSGKYTIIPWIIVDMSKISENETRTRTVKGRKVE